MASRKTQSKPPQHEFALMIWLHATQHLLFRHPKAWLVYIVMLGCLFYLTRWLTPIIWGLGLLGLYMGCFLAAVLDEQKNTQEKSLYRCLARGFTIVWLPALLLGAGMTLAMRFQFYVPTELGNQGGLLGYLYATPAKSQNSVFTGLWVSMASTGLTALMALLFALIVAGSPFVASAYGLLARYFFGLNYMDAHKEIYPGVERHGWVITAALLLMLVSVLVVSLLLPILVIPAYAFVGTLFYVSFKDIYLRD